MLATRTRGTLFQLAKRFVSTSSCLCGRKSRVPFDKRFPVFPDDVAPGKPGGSEEMMKLLPEELRAPTGINDAVTGEYIHIPEMVPEFVVPDLTGFELKAYVSYKAKEINQSALTPHDIFNAVYARDVEDDLREGKLEVTDDGQIKCKDGRVLNIDQFEASDSSRR
ncbi:unnamed protein product [Candidula unifasciata]|uniref:Mitochondrial ribosomal protein L41 n=1 Tax=Candidula unifasciata TaxID=100452 RepID=A0A8S3ZWT3_9EUPU|nr:unnamed protein product [Candidula unifasciata]